MLVVLRLESLGTFLHATYTFTGCTETVLTLLSFQTKFTQTENTASVKRPLQFGWNSRTERYGTCDTCYTPALIDRAIPLPGSKEPSCFLETNLKEKVISDRNCYLMASFKKVEKRKAAISSIISVFQLSSLQ